MATEKKKTTKEAKPAEEQAMYCIFLDGQLWSDFTDGTLESATEEAREALLAENATCADIGRLVRRLSRSEPPIVSKDYK